MQLHCESAPPFELLPVQEGSDIPRALRLASFTPDGDWPEPAAGRRRPSSLQGAVRQSQHKVEIVPITSGVELRRTSDVDGATSRRSEAPSSLILVGRGDLVRGLVLGHRPYTEPASRPSDLGNRSEVLGDISAYPWRTERQAGEGFISLTQTMRRGAVGDTPRAVWLARLAAVMEARGDRDEALRLYGEASVQLTGRRAEPALASGRAMICGTHSVMSEREEDWGAVGRSTKVDVDRMFPYSARVHFLATCIARAYRRHFCRLLALIGISTR